MKKRKQLVGICAALIVASLTACGGGDAEETTVASNIDPITGKEIVQTEAVVETEAETEVVETQAPTQEVQIKIVEHETDAATPSTVAEFEPVRSDEGRWQKGNNGSWKFILNSTNAEAKEAAVEIDGTIYFFDKDGNMANEGWAKDTSGVWRYVKNGKYQTGWINDTYYADESGMKTGLSDIDGVKYLFGSDGVAVDGWKEVDGKWYYGTKGKLSIGVVEIEDVTYGFDENGAMLTGEAEIGGKRYVFSDDGVAMNGLIDTENGKIYCDNGEVKTGKVEVDGVVLKFAEDGKLVTDEFVNGIYINADGTADSKKRVTNVGAFADKDGLDKLLNSMPDKFIESLFVTDGWKLRYDAAAKGSMEEIEGSGAVSASGKYLRFHNLDTIGHRFGHYVSIKSGKASGISAIREEEFASLGWDEYFGKSDTEYFSEACGKILEKKFDKEKAPKTYEYISTILKDNYGFAE